MEYLLIIVLQLIGIGFHVGQKVLEIDKRIPGDTFQDVLHVFLIENRVTLFISVLVLALNIVGHYIVEVYTDFPTTIAYYTLYGFGIALVLGYAGQRLVYKYLAKAEEVISQKVDDRLNK